MKFVFSFNNQSSVFLREHFQAPETVKATFADRFKVSHISFDSLKKDYHIFFFFRIHSSFLQSQSMPARCLNTQSEKKCSTLAERGKKEGRAEGQEENIIYGSKLGRWVT